MKPLPFLLGTLMLLVLQPARAQADPLSAAHEKGWLGVFVLDVDPHTARALRMERPQGALVVDVAPGGAGERAGLHRGDVILSLNGEPIDERGELPRLVRQQPAGSSAAIEIWRAGRAHSIEAELGSRPAVLPAHAAVRALAAAGGGPEPARRDDAPQANGNALGLRLSVLAPAEAQAMDIGFGLRIERISPAARAPQLEPGDVIVGINNEEFSSVEEFNALVAKHAPGSSVALRVRRGLEAQYVPVKVQG